MKNLATMCLIATGTITMNAQTPHIKWWAGWRRLSPAFFSLCFLLMAYLCAGQNVGISAIGVPPHPSAGLDINFTDRGLLIPRMTTAQRNTISSPTLSLLIFNTDNNCFQFYNASGAWENLYCSTGCIGAPSAPTAGTNTATQTQIVWNWNTSPGATAYYYNTVNNFATATNNGASISYTQTGLTCNTAYTLYVWASNTCGNSTATTLTQTTSACPKIYVIGGWYGGNLSTNEAYNPATNTWTTKASMPTARMALTSSAVNNVIYVIGGNDGSGSTVSFSTKNEAYDPASNTWTTKASMPTARFYPTSSAVNNVIYVIGGLGSGGLSTNEAYDPASNTWTTKAPMPTARYGLTSSVAP